MFIQACSVLILPVRKVVRKLITKLRITAYPGHAFFKASTGFCCSVVISDRSLASNAAATRGEICRHSNKEAVAPTRGATLAVGIGGFQSHGKRRRFPPPPCQKLGQVGKASRVPKFLDLLQESRTVLATLGPTFRQVLLKEGRRARGRLHLAPLRQLHHAHPGGDAISADSRLPHECG